MGDPKPRTVTRRNLQTIYQEDLYSRLKCDIVKVVSYQHNRETNLAPFDSPRSTKTKVHPASFQPTCPADCPLVPCQFCYGFGLKRGYPVESRIETANVEGLVDLYRQFQAGKIRFLWRFAM